MATQEVERRRYTDDDLRGLSFNDLAGDAVDISTVLGNGFTLLRGDHDKARLIGVPFILVDWHFNAGDAGEYVTAYVITKNEDKFILNDGSTGVCAQLRAYTDRTGQSGGLGVRNGLRRSDYTIKVADRNGELRDTPATTFYLDTSR